MNSSIHALPWYRSLYWRIAAGLFAFLALMVAAEGVLFLWMNDRIAASMPARSPRLLGLMVASDVATALAADPMLDPDATKYDTISYLQVIERQLKVMDSTAITLCMDNRLPIVVFDLRKAGNIRKVILGEPIGTTVSH